jgi:H+/Cl- antiporter ClcA
MSKDAPKFDDSKAGLPRRQFLGLLIFTAALGVPISVAAYWFLWAVHALQQWAFETLPILLGFDAAPWWWPLPLLAVGGLIVGAAIAWTPGGGGHSPADGFKAGTPPKPTELAGILLAAVVSLSCGAVVGPESPLIALGSGLAVLALRSLTSKAPDTAVAVVGGAGAFAAIAFLLGSPIVGAFLVLEAVGLASPKAKAVLVPGLLCSGIGFLVAVGVNAWTGIGKVSLVITNVPSFTHPHGTEFLWAIGIGIGAALLGESVRSLALLVRRHVELRPVILTPVAGLVVGVLAIIYSRLTGNAPSDALFSGEESLPHLIHNAGTYSVGATSLLIVCKGLAYSISLSGFRGGPVFPSMFIGAAAGIVLSHLPGLSATAGIAMGIGAMTAVMLRLPMTAVLLPSLLLGREGISAMPLVIVAVVVAYLAVNSRSE